MSNYIILYKINMVSVHVIFWSIFILISFSLYFKGIINKTIPLTLVGYEIDYMYDYSLHVPCIVELLIMHCTTCVLHIHVFGFAVNEC